MKITALENTIYNYVVKYPNKTNDQIIKFIMSSKKRSELYTEDGVRGAINHLKELGLFY